MNNNTKFNRSSAYKIISVAAITIIAIAFAFPLYWIITGANLPPSMPQRRSGGPRNG